MSKRDVEFYIVDILIAYNKIKRYIENIDNATKLLYSELVWDGVIRELEIIGEATNKLLKEGFLTKEYRSIVDFRNQIVHAYFGIDENIVWEIANESIDDFKKDLLIIVKNRKLNLKEAIESAKVDFSYNKEIIKFLDTL